MENLWMVFALSYGLLKSVRDCMKKEAIKKSSLMETLFWYMLVGFVFTLPDLKSAFALSAMQIFWILVKAVIVSVGFLLSFIAIRGLPVGLYSIMTLCQMVFTTLFGVAFLKEAFGIHNGIGLVLVVGGLILVNIKRDNGDNKKVKFLALLAAIGYTFFNSISSVMDKVLTKDITPGQLQFWFMLFSVIFYGILIMVNKEKISVKTLKTNFWIPAMGFLLVFGDRLLFIANSSPKSKVTVMTLLLQCSVIATIVLGKVIYKEKGFLYKILCACIIITGLVIGSI